MIHVDIISDTVCPWCYIGKRRFERAVEMRPDYDYQVGWRPFQLNPDMPAAGMPRAQYLGAKFGGAERAGQIYQAVSNAGTEEGLAFDFDGIRQQPNTFDSHRLIRWAGSAGVQDAVVEALFLRYFIDGTNIGDREALIEVAGDCGMDAELVRELFDKDQDRDLVMAEEGVARRMGISGVPCFIVGHKYAVSGAQDPSVLTHVFDLAMEDAAKAAKDEAVSENAAAE
ncbi:MAG: DsbA family oxidoreductase [Alphaproteobacteria bacterium]|jgi:predicted DsbA family dithiol-disulfide isomerase|nr:DsbA family oxidoreductase [Alphaproteobacteria bacterium]MDP6567775.1 DsbA family oxidoreductase [Alphaproteobacteria bacterium]